MNFPMDVTNLWEDGLRPPRYGQDDITYQCGMAWLDAVCATIEDWGCGSGHAAQFARNAAVLGIDGSPGRRVDVVDDLRTYKGTKPDGIYMRHVLEHNMDWETVLQNALGQFRKRMVLVIFTPFSYATVCLPVPPTQKVPDISFRKEDLTKHFASMIDHEDSLVTGAMYGTEHVFYLARVESLHPDLGEQEAETRQAA